MLHDVIIGRQTIQTHSAQRQKMFCDYLTVDDLDAIQRKLLNKDDDDDKKTMVRRETQAQRYHDETG